MTYCSSLFNFDTRRLRDNLELTAWNTYFDFIIMVKADIPFLELVGSHDRSKHLTSNATLSFPICVETKITWCKVKQFTKPSAHAYSWRYTFWLSHLSKVRQTRTTYEQKYFAPKCLRFLTVLQGLYGSQYKLHADHISIDWNALVFIIISSNCGTPPTIPNLVGSWDANICIALLIILIVLFEYAVTHMCAIFKIYIFYFHRMHSKWWQKNPRHYEDT